MECLRQIRASGVAGLAMWVQHDQKETAELLNSYARNQFPVVLMDRYLRESDVDFVVADNEAIGRQLTRKLIALGHQRIGLITSFPMATSGEDRARGFKLALEEAGLENGGYPIGKMSRRDGSVAAMQEVNRIMASKQAPTAFFCNHDALARELATQLRNLGYEIPGDVAIASVDDEHIPETMGIPMFTADQRGREIGEQTAEVLLARIREPQRSPDQRFITPEYRDYLT